jgi:hypothetical protein
MPGYLIVLPVYLVIDALIIFAIFRFLSKRGVARKRAVLLSCLILGVSIGTLAVLYGNSEGQSWIDPISVPLSEQVYYYSINHFGDNTSAHAHYTIPWFLRIPQAAFFISVIIWSAVGFIAQFVYNLKAKSFEHPGSRSLAVLALLVVFLIAVSGIIYAMDKPPGETVAFEAKSGADGPLPSWVEITTYRVEGLVYPFGKEAKAAYEFDIRAEVTNTGMEKGIASIDIMVDGEVLNSQKVAILPGETKLVMWVVIFPREGFCTVSIGSLSETIEVAKSQVIY